MMGPMTYGRHLVSAQRLPFTAAYFGSIGLTLYFSLGVSYSSSSFFILLILVRCVVFDVSAALSGGEVLGFGGGEGGVGERKVQSADSFL